MKTKVFHIPISSAVEFAVGVLDQLGLTSKVTRVVGFSQGAYVTPFIGLRLPRVRQVISVNGRFKHEDLSDSKIPFRMDAINGEQDDIVDPVLARQSHHSLMDRGVRGTFNLIPKGTHRFSKDFAVVLAKLLLE
jgi:predicted esterase